MIDIKITKTSLDINKIYQSTRTNQSGCTNLFVGTVRDNNLGRDVKYLDFETYEKMALKEMQKIAETAQAKWKVINITVHHREGKVEVGEVAVIVAVSARHRDHAINATHYIIDTLKFTVPIWKKEVFDGGEEWVSAHP
ncbi:MAG: molybdenum cofactor biosynthesis protein MoaE [Patescibacteria group bacterium]